MVLLTVGATSVDIISKHKDLTEFTSDDFNLLLILIGDDPSFILLPNIVSEAANLLRHHRDPEKRAIMATFLTLIRQNEERYIESSIVVERKEFGRLGITDTAILELCTSGYEILTADAGLHIAAIDQGIHATNFNHKREEFRLL